MVRKVEIHLDALAMIVLVFAASFGFNLYQRFQYASLLKEHTALQWKSQDTAFNLKVANIKLEKLRRRVPEVMPDISEGREPSTRGAQ